MLANDAFKEQFFSLKAQFYAHVEHMPHVNGIWAPMVYLFQLVVLRSLYIFGLSMPRCHLN
eukprot:c6549_g1_i1 orf=47-229(+)